MKPVSKGIASSEKDGLAGADLYSFHHYYGPFRHPIQPSLFLRWSGLAGPFGPKAGLLPVPHAPTASGWSNSSRVLCSGSF